MPHFKKLISVYITLKISLLRKCVFTVIELSFNKSMNSYRWIRPFINLSGHHFGVWSCGAFIKRLAFVRIAREFDICMENFGGKGNKLFDQELKSLTQMAENGIEGSVTFAGFMWTQNPDVTVVVGTFGADDQLTRALNSLMLQDYEGPMEILISYDLGTPRSTMDIILKWVENSWDGKSTVRVELHRHMKLFRDREYMMHKTNGRYISFLDYDNTYDSDKVTAHVNVMKDYGEHFTFSNQRDTDIQGKILKETHMDVPAYYKDFETLLFTNYVDSNTIFMDQFFCTNILFRALSILKDPYFDEIIEDYFYGLLASITGNLRYLDRVLGNYTYHERNITSRLFMTNSIKEFTRIAHFNERVQKTIMAITVVNEELSFSSKKIYALVVSAIQQKDLQNLSFHIGLDGGSHSLETNFLRSLVKTAAKLPHLRRRMRSRKFNPKR